MSNEKWIHNLDRDPDLSGGDSIDEIIKKTREELHRADEIMNDSKTTGNKQYRKAEPEPLRSTGGEKFELHIPDVYADPVLNEEDEEDEPPAPKKRMAAGWRVLIYVTCVLLASVVLAIFSWKCADDVCSLTKQEQDVTVTVSETDTIEDVTKTLKSNGLIEYPWLFKFYCWFSHAEEKIDPGTYTLSTRYDYHALVSGMISTSANRATAKVTIPEGYDCGQIFDLLEKEGVCTKAELEDTAANNVFDYDFLSGLDYGNSNRLEGYLFPDTYEFYVGEKPVNVLDKFLKNFDKKFDSDMRTAVADLNTSLRERMQNAGFSESEIEDGMMDLHKVVIVASLIEKETASASESTAISSVIYNRLCSKTYPLREIDATVLYALGEHKTELTTSDLMVDSPYNTRKYPGLPIGPISNPGISSLKAALYPENTNYYFYALDTDGKHHFSETYGEHQKFLDGLETGNDAQ